MAKKITIGLLLSFVGVLLMGPRSFASIVDSLHDFSKLSWNTSGEICIACHTPHNATSTSTPLWNHKLTAATFTAYASSSLNATVGQPSTASKACLSCHDGTVAVDAFGGAAGGRMFTVGPYKLGTDLANDHPVSFTYDSALATADGGLHNPAVKTVPALGGKTVDAGMLIDHKVECSSCHDVHKNKGDSPTTSDYLLLVRNSRSALCLTCHNK